MKEIPRAIQDYCCEYTVGAEGTPGETVATSGGFTGAVGDFMTVIIGFVLATALSGCASFTDVQYPSENDKTDNFGEAVKADIVSQAVYQGGYPLTDPDAAAQLEGTAGKATIDRYISSFVTPIPSGNSFSIGMGSGTAPSQQTGGTAPLGGY